MPNPRFSSLPNMPNMPDVRQSPYKEWLQMTQTTPEYMKLVNTFCGMPKAWIEWTEKQTQLSINRGNNITNPLDYRLGVLWNGIIVLQEIKFICDIIENSFRQSVADFMNVNSICYGDLCQSIPDWNNVKQTYEGESGNQVSLADIISSQFVTCLSFYGLTETMARNWKYIRKSASDGPGFSTLFWTTTICRDNVKFRNDMKKVRKCRNDVAHSRRLFLNSEATDVYNLACLWLSPLNITLKERVLSYREKRPKFLQMLKF